MSTIGRNRPCPCGSGKKYKLCCGAGELRRGAARARRGKRLPSTEHELRAHLIERLMRFIGASVPEDELGAARDRFLGPDLRRAIERAGRVREQEVEAFLEIPFNEWLVHDYASPEGETVIGRFLAHHGEGLPERVRGHLEYSAGTVTSVYELTRVTPGCGFEATDLFRGGEVSVRERSGSRRLVKWDVVVTRIIEVGGRHVVSGGLVQVGRAESGDLLTHLRRAFEGFLEAHPDASRDEFLKSHGEIPWRWVARTWLEPPSMPTLTTFDGEPMMFCRAEYRILDDRATREAIEEHRELEFEPGGDEGDEFRWCGSPPAGTTASRPTGGISLGTQTDDGRITRGWVTIDGAELRIQTQSEARLRRLKALVEDAAGTWVEHRVDTIESPGEALARARGEDDPERDLDTDGGSGLPPEVEAELTERLMVEYYRAWLDDEIPALDGETPRRAVRTAAGRAKVLDLIKDIEHMVERDRRDGRPSWDPSWLREELGLEDG